MLSAWEAQCQDLMLPGDNLYWTRVISSQESDPQTQGTRENQTSHTEIWYLPLSTMHGKPWSSLFGIVSARMYQWHKGSHHLGTINTGEICIGSKQFTLNQFNTPPIYQMSMASQRKEKCKNLKMS